MPECIMELAALAQQDGFWHYLTQRCGLNAKNVRKISLTKKKHIMDAGRIEGAAVLVLQFLFDMIGGWILLLSVLHGTYIGFRMMRNGQGSRNDWILVAVYASFLIFFTTTWFFLNRYDFGKRQEGGAKLRQR